MADKTLKTIFVNGDEFTPGTTASTDALNGITDQVNNNTNINIPARLIYAGSDTEGSIASSDTETTVATVTIPANKFATRSIVSAAIGLASASAIAECTFRLKIGAAASETLKQTIKLVSRHTHSAGEYVGGSMLFMDIAEDYTSELSVIITAENSENSATVIGTCFQLVVIGY